MYMLDYDNAASVYEERLRDAEQHRAHTKLVQAALDYQRENGQVGFLSQLAQRLRVNKAHPAETADTAEAADARHAHAH